MERRATERREKTGITDESRHFGLPHQMDVNLNINVHFHKPLRIVVHLDEHEYIDIDDHDGPEPEPEPTPSPTPTAVKATIKLGGSQVPGTINVDTTNETVTVAFVDDKGNETPAPAGAQVTFNTSDPNVASVTADPSNPLVGQVTPSTPGQVSLSASFNGTALEADGTTPIPDPDPVTVQVDPGAPVGARLTPSV